MTKDPTEVDRHIGRRVRARRMVVGLSQEKLASALGVTFQQVQKYEQGRNRISASRLLSIASVLSTPIGFFYAGAEHHADAVLSAVGVVVPTELVAFVESSECAEIARAFSPIADTAVRQQVVAVVLATCSLAMEQSGARQPSRKKVAA